MPRKTRKITVLLDDSEFEDFDRFCQRQGFKKSTLLARLIRDFLSSETIKHESSQTPAAASKLPRS